MNYFILRSTVYLEKDILEIKRLNCLSSNFLGFDFNLWSSEVTLGCDSKAHVNSYVSSIDTFSLSLTDFEIFAFKICRLRPWPFSLYRTVFEIFDYKIFRVWPWPLTFRGHLRSKIFLPFKSPYITSYLTSIDTFYLVPFLKYLTSKFLGFDLWPLEVTWGQKYFCHSNAHIWLPI